MKIVNGLAVSPIKGQLMSALQHSNSKRLQQIWKTSIAKYKKELETKKEEQN